MAWRPMRPIYTLIRISLLMLWIFAVPLSAQESPDRAPEDSEPTAATDVPPTVSAIPCTNVPGAGPEMILIEAGRFTMGSPEYESGRDPDEGPQREIAVVRPFAIARCETTVAEFRIFAQETGYVTEAEAGGGCYVLNDFGTEAVQRKDQHWRDPGFPQTDTHPVVCVSWNDAVAYAEWLSVRTGERYRLPTEAEWEYAARAGSRASRFWGEDPNAGCTYANAADQALKRRYPIGRFSIVACDDGADHTAPAGSFARNAFGLSDMLGNAWEWVRDCYAENLASIPEDGTAWEGLEGEACALRVARGGGWFSVPGKVRSASRDWVNPDAALVGKGFRLARDL